MIGLLNTGKVNLQPKYEHIKQILSSLFRNKNKGRWKTQHNFKDVTMLNTGVLVLTVLLSLSKIYTCRRSDVYTTAVPRCTPKIMEVEIKYEGCKDTTVKLYGCGGACQSDTTMRLHSKMLQVKCNCCKPSRYAAHKAFAVGIQCGDKEKVVNLMSAVKCSCQSCGKYLIDAFVD